MRILEKYVVKNYISAFLFCITLLIVLAIIGDILGFLDDIFRRNIPFNAIIAFYFYLAPFAFVNMVPFATLLAAVYVFNSLSKNREVTAFITSGLSLWELLRPVLVVTFILCLFTLIINERFVPQTMEKANAIKNEELEQLKGTPVDTKDLAIYGEGDKIVYAKSFTPETNTLHHVIIHKQNKDHVIIEKTSIRHLKWLKDDKKWLGEEVIVFKIGSEGKFEGNPEMYKTKTIDIVEEPKDFSKSQSDPKVMSYAQLKKYIHIFSIGAPSAVRRLLVDLNYKLAFPFTALITVLVGVPFSIETGRASALIGMARGISIAILYLPVMAVSLALGKGGVLPPIASAWLSNIVFAVLGIYFINRKS